MRTAVTTATPVKLLSILAVIAAVTVSVFGGEPDSGPNPQDGRQGSVWVVNRDLGELTIFDAATGAVLKSLPVGAGAHDICISEHAGKAYITSETIHKVTTVDTTTLEIDTIDVGPLPHHIEPSHDERTIFVSLASHTPGVGAPQYAAIDTRDNSVTYVSSSNNPLARSHGPRPSFDGGTLYIAHDLGDELTGVNLETGSIVLTVGGIVRAEEVIPTRHGDLLWVSSRGDGTVKRVDVESQTVKGSVAVGVQPESVMLTPNERTLIASLRGTPASLAFVDTDNIKLLETIPIAGNGTFGDLAVITPDGHHVYATFDAQVGGVGGVAVVDVNTRSVVDTWAYPGKGRPHGIWYSRKKVRP